MAKSPLGRYREKETPTPKKSHPKVKTGSSGVPRRDLAAATDPSRLLQSPQIHRFSRFPPRNLGGLSLDPAPCGSGNRLQFPTAAFPGILWVFPHPRTPQNPFPAPFRRGKDEHRSGSLPARGNRDKIPKKRCRRGNSGARWRGLPMRFPHIFP